MKMPKLFTILAAFVLASFAAHPAHADEVEDAQAKLQKQVEALDSISPFVERPELGRVLVLKKSTQKVLDSIQKNGLGHTQTFKAYQEMMISYHYSTSFFRQISTSNTQKTVSDLIALTDQIIKDRGLDDDSISQIVANDLMQSYQLTEQLMKLNIPGSLKAKIQALRPDLGQAIAIARQGDRPRAFEAGTKVYREILAMYPDFNQIAASNGAYSIVLELMGLNEFYAEYAQIKE